MVLRSCFALWFWVPLTKRMFRFLNKTKMASLVISPKRLDLSHRLERSFIRRALSLHLRTPLYLALHKLRSQIPLRLQFQARKTHSETCSLPELALCVTGWEYKRDRLQNLSLNLSLLYSPLSSSHRKKKVPKSNLRKLQRNPLTPFGGQTNISFFEIVLEIMSSIIRDHQIEIV